MSPSGTVLERAGERQGVVGRASDQRKAGSPANMDNEKIWAMKTDDQKIRLLGAGRDV
jgi:hypothetical protein